MIDTAYMRPIADAGWRVRQSLRAPASIADIVLAEKSLNCHLPESLRSLLLETDGVMNMMSVNDGEWFDENWVIWPIAEIAEKNQWLRVHHPNRRLERFLFFASPGVDGIMFGFPAATVSVPDAPVFAWYPDETEDTLKSHGLEKFLAGVIGGEICV